MGEERVQKILSRAGIASRRAAEELIARGEVTINGRVAVLGDKADPEHDSVKVGGKRITGLVPHRYLLLHKPDGYVSTRSDPEERKTVIDLIPARLRKALVPVGRLDFHTEGVLLLTTDGEWAQKVAHPRNGCEKVYHVKVSGVPDDGQVDRIRGGMVIEGQRTRPAEVIAIRTTGRGRDLGNSWWEVRLREGRTRQIREMFFRIGAPVQRLKRVAIGPVTTAHLAKGQWRELSEEEVEQLRRGAAAPRRKAGPTAGGRRRGPAPRGARPAAGARRERPAAESPGAKGDARDRRPRRDTGPAGRGPAGAGGGGRAVSRGTGKGPPRAGGGPGGAGGRKPGGSGRGAPGGSAGRPPDRASGKGGSGRPPATRPGRGPGVRGGKGPDRGPGRGSGPGGKGPGRGPAKGSGRGPGKGPRGGGRGGNR